MRENFILKLCILLLFAGKSVAENIDSASVNPGKTVGRLSDLYTKAEQSGTAWPDSLKLVAAQITAEGNRIQDKTAVIRGERYKAQALWRLGSHSEAMKSAIAALANAEKWKMTSEIPDIYAVIGNLHKEKANYKMAFQAVDKGMQAARIAKDTTSIIYMTRLKAMFTQGLGSQENDTAMIHRSLNMHLEGLKIAESSPRFERSRVAYYNNIAQVLVKRKETDQAFFYVKKGIKLAKKYNQLISLTYSYTWLSQIYLQRQDIERSKKYLFKALRITQELKNPFREMEVNRYLYQALEQTNNYKATLAAYTRYIEIRDSLRVLDNVRQIGELQVQYEAEKKDQQIAALGAINNVKTREISWITIGLGLFLILSLFMIFQYRIIARSNRILEENNGKINEQSDQMRLLMKELHHRVKNNLQIVSNLLSLQSNRLTDEDARQSIRTGQQRIEAMSLIHKSLYNQDNVNMVDMREYLTNLVESVMQSFGLSEERFRLILQVDVDELDIDMAMPLGLIVNEWITNSFKHAYQHVTNPELSLKLEMNDAIQLEIRDNGNGMDMKLWDRPGGSFGIKLIKVLSRQLDGQCRVAVDAGTSFTLEIPLPQLREAG
ncbi:tetratricopeptide repeat-containing sensor histidine kinase [Dyadobacter pollutisoli]|uniref:histidine kinase n=1 Tax=Dyadobacter pollutisoli TaxID=2910158 RepID=A0A9E8NFN0_9BACT|nr:sensor histidine kinase [Dyadobacter pollutisoli]WAC13706.1 ATP-binding protein [Dyadobacter pollutisoli]